VTVTIQERCACGSTITATGGRYRSTSNPANPRSAEEIVERWRTDHRHEHGQASRDAARSDDAPSGGGADGQDVPDASTGRTRDKAHQAAHHAQTQGGQAGIATGLAAIAYAILAGQETRP